jgi:hypothetical protein
VSDLGLRLSGYANPSVCFDESCNSVGFRRVARGVINNSGNYLASMKDFYAISFENTIACLYRDHRPPGPFLLNAMINKDKCFHVGLFPN